ncbi:MAG: ROK family protein [Acidimicrobiia bacterium]|nr:ROK family protein [bacterium]MCY3579054.1 ROK family protein [bacterium]MXZ06614.1 ROK family protein [Acidimicrobiia bacterium]
MDSKNDLTLGIDLGGTKMAFAHVTSEGEIVEYRTMPRPATAAEMETIPVEVAHSLLLPRIRAVGIGAAGLVDTDTGVLIWGPNVEGQEVRFRSIFEAELGVPTVVDNDTNVSCLAEARVGAARRYRHVCMITLGTGIGGAWMVNGRLYRGRGFAGEVGHMPVDVGGPLCTCGQRGCWETFASGRRLDQMARDLVATRPGGLVAKMAQGVTPRGQHLTSAAMEGDPDALESLEEMAWWLGVGLAGLVAAFDPEIVVVGGGVSRVGDLFLDAARQSFWEALEGSDHREKTPIVCAELQEDAGVIGAGLYAWESLSGT